MVNITICYYCLFFDWLLKIKLWGQMARFLNNNLNGRMIKLQNRYSVLQHIFAMRGWQNFQRASVCDKKQCFFEILSRFMLENMRKGFIFRLQKNCVLLVEILPQAIDLWVSGSSAPASPPPPPLPDGNLKLRGGLWPAPFFLTLHGDAVSGYTL